MSMVNGSTSAGGAPQADFDALLQAAAAQVTRLSGEDVPPEVLKLSQELLAGLTAGGSGLLPDLEKPSTSASGNPAIGALTAGGLSLETLLDAVGAKQRETETRAGTASLKVRAQQRADANAEKMAKIKENLKKLEEYLNMSPFLKAFKIIGMIFAAVASVSLIATGGGAAVAAGIISSLLLTSNILEEATDGKVGFSPGFIAGKIAEACGASKETAGWIKMGVDLATTIAMCVVTLGAGAGSTAGQWKEVARVGKVVGTIGQATTGIASSALGIKTACLDRDMENSRADRKRLDAIMEKIAMLNNMDLEHLKEVLRRSEAVMQSVSDIVQEGNAASTAILTGNPPMA